MKKLLSPKVLFLLVFLLVSVFFSWFARINYILFSTDPLEAKVFLGSIFRGLTFDVTVALILGLPVLIWWGFSPQSWLQGRRATYFQRIAFTFLFFIWILTLVSEVVFIGEFNARFNFIAVDYLVYTQEVLENIWQSYPLVPIFSAIFLGVGSLGYWVGGLRFFNPANGDNPSNSVENLKESSAQQGSILPLKKRMWASGGVIIFTLVMGLWINESRVLRGSSAAEAELAKNSLYTLFAAYFNNSIDFRRFYAALVEKDATNLVYKIHKEESFHAALSDKSFGPEGLNSGRRELISQENPHSIMQNIKRTKGSLKYNVILVLMESMSGHFLTSLGSNRSDLTPNLDRLAKQSLFFSQAYATGTRTVRGIEAVTLSIPPTPGQSIVRREKGSDVFNIGTVFRDRGYSTKFIYGGKSYFDNMGNFFNSNGFKVLDQTQFPKDQLHFTNAWGVCDEDLFQQSLGQADHDFKMRKPFFQFILTTSNHRPFTYPEGKVSIPSGTSRHGAVQYSDYAIGQFMAQAQTKPWFDQTLFIFVADHNSGVAGGTQILPSDYHIPMFFYAPKIIKAQTVDLVSSQIDLAPTLFGMMNFSYQTRFFGRDILKASVPRAFLATYQRVAYWEREKMVILSPNRKIEEIHVDGEKLTKQKEYVFSDRAVPLGDKVFTQEQKNTVDPLDSVLEKTLAYYTAASDWFNSGRLQAELKFPDDENLRQ
ncbi:MAG: LTA synthase family protein [Bdellovibrionales bacterium]|nr:LTA synthase family protein [Bdellovibrionales bacterium]